MAFASKKRKSAAVIDDSDVDAEVSTKRGKGASGTAFQPSAKAQTDSDGSHYWELSKNRRVTISDFKGKALVNIREYYQKDDEWLPGKKGISLTIEQYSVLIGVMPRLEDLLERKGEKVPRPDYSGDGPADDGEAVKEEDEEDTKKANIEATSDEEE
ncbi:transcriptional Coactivator p15-domain-containing protein [Exophiala viscosa]|uniref:Transcriptional Coactivator p15-domain-containing protein n=1 Tax=Exophiala viscosa TaxID=2486360 RepID=A0AAN6DMJ0_9EURO|nr:transcriptional Coactivator p15-domain-containing protein [Exophiala viscosa]KAI1621036.1 transcriptional Coactivator p15-domain-containing protein [Exophiala viscosa]